jgi:protein ImuA
MVAHPDSLNTLKLSDHTPSVQELRSSLHRMQREFRPGPQAGPRSPSKDIVSTGIAALDRILPARGLMKGTLSEWIATEPGSGAVSLAMRVASRVQRGGTLILVDQPRQFYAPAIQSLGVCLAETILVRPATQGDELWVLEQSLRCPGVSVVLCQLDRLTTQQFRRLQLAAGSGTAIGMLIRPAVAQRQSSWADVRLQVSPRPSSPRSFRRCLNVRCVYAKGSLADQTVDLEFCDETGRAHE